MITPWHGMPSHTDVLSPPHLVFPAHRQSGSWDISKPEAPGLAYIASCSEFWRPEFRGRNVDPKKWEGPENPEEYRGMSILYLRELGK